MGESSIIHDRSAPELVTDSARLSALCEQWRQVPAIALDTEFIRVRTFFPKPGLIQLSDGQSIYLLDPLKINDWQTFQILLEAPDVVKLLHSASEDLILFLHSFGCLPRPLFDTQKAAAFLNYGYSISYQNLVQDLMGVELSKAQTRSDWLQRPLTAEQLNYAALDVAYLHEIYGKLRALLVERKLLAPAQQSCAQMLDIARSAEDPANWTRLYQQLGGAWRLDTRQLGALKLLCNWREEQARQRDKPRSWIARDQDLIALAETMPKARSELPQMEELNRNLHQKDADQILALIAESHPVANDVKAALNGSPLDPQERKQLKRLQQAVRRISSRTGIAEELLARKKQLTVILRLSSRTGNLRWPPEFEEWQKILLTPELAPLLTHTPLPSTPGIGSQ